MEPSAFDEVAFFRAVMKLSEALAQAIDRPVTLDELRRELERPIGSNERDEVLSLVHWFSTRYPSPEARLAYVRRAYARWLGSMS